MSEINKTLYDYNGNIIYPNTKLNNIIDYKNIGSIDFDVEYEAFENGKFLINDVVLNQKVSISSEKYFVL